MYPDVLHLGDRSYIAAQAYVTGEKRTGADCTLTPFPAGADLAEEANVETSWLAPLNDLLRRAAEAGHGPHSVSALTEMLRKGA